MKTKNKTVSKTQNDSSIFAAASRKFLVLLNERKLETSVPLEQNGGHAKIFIQNVSANRCYATIADGSLT